MPPKMHPSQTCSGPLLCLLAFALVTGVSCQPPAVSLDWLRELLATPVGFAPVVLHGSWGTVTPLVLTAPSRREHAVRLLRSLGVERGERVLFPAPMAFHPHSGASSIANWWKCDERASRFPELHGQLMESVGSAAVFLGHMRMLRFFLNNSPANYLLVMEDDAMLEPGVTLEAIHGLIQVLANHNRQLAPWDVINLGRSNFDDCRGVKIMDKVMLTQDLDFKIVRPTSVVAGALGLLYSRQGVVRLLRQFETEGPMDAVPGEAGQNFKVCYSFDSWLSRHPVRHMLTLSPPLFYQDPDMPSLWRTPADPLRYYKMPQQYC